MTKTHAVLTTDGHTGSVDKMVSKDYFSLMAHINSATRSEEGSTLKGKFTCQLEYRAFISLVKNAYFAEPDSD